MNWIVWDNTLDTGHALIDSDHQELARLFNLLPETAGMPRGKELCGKVLGQIIAHARAHFEREQQLMAEHRYPKIAQHSAEHAMLLDQALIYQAEFDANASEPDIALIDFPEVWLSFHILFSDKDLARFLAQTA
ncbi:MAG: bacteriohemerythrin [Proteobacteria bacterium]|nr:bacteriohemerythrin [Pseudomonadota bacterium]